MWFLLNIYLQQVLYYDAFAGGAALLPMQPRRAARLCRPTPRPAAGSDDAEHHQRQSRGDGDATGDADLNRPPRA